jgi:hypothetical protein
MRQIFLLEVSKQFPVNFKLSRNQLIMHKIRTKKKLNLILPHFEEKACSLVTVKERKKNLILIYLKKNLKF